MSITAAVAIRLGETVMVRLQTVCPELIHEKKKEKARKHPIMQLINRLRSNRSVVTVLVASLFAIGGYTLINLSNAASSSKSIEAETGTLDSKAHASIVRSAQASGGAYVRFGNRAASLLKPATSFTKHADLRYSDASPRLLLDLYTPNHDGLKPLIVYLHGGAWIAGSKNDCLPVNDAGPKAFLHRGFAVACINYRYSTEAIYPAQIIDVKASIRWLRSQAAAYKLYDGKIAIWGASAGGHLAALAGTTGDIKQYDVGANLAYPSTVDAVVDYYGPTDLVTLRHDPTLDPGLYQSGMLFLGGDGPDIDERAKAASPTTYIDSLDAPFYIAHGTQDNLIPVSQGKLLDQKLKAAGVASTLDVINGAGHGGAPFVESGRLDAIARFLDQAIR
jgi:acetyl esterase/lipase